MKRDDHLNTDAATKKLTRRSFAVYLLLLAAPALLLYLLPFALLRLPSFERWGGTMYGPALDFGFHAVNENADVVLFGDSSVLYNVNPRLVSEETGLKIINLPNTVGGLPVTDDLVLSRYLKSNRAPRLIVLYFSPWNLDYHSRHLTQSFEGEEMLFRNGSLDQIIAFVRRRPSEALLFPVRMFSAAPKASLMAQLRHEDRDADIRATMGHIDAQSFRPHLTAPCTLPPVLLASSGFESVQRLAQRYANAGTRVLIFVAPIPSCINAGEVLGRPFAALPGAPPRTIDPSLFLDDGFYTHLDPAAVPAVSRTLADAIQAFLR
jgi:hypothetical protein